MTEYNGEILDCIVIGGGQAGLSCGYYLNKLDIKYLILDANASSGGAWQNTWDSLKIFSPPQQSSLPGFMMPNSDEEYPSKNHVINYLKNYELRYNLPIHRPVKIVGVSFSSNIYHLKSVTGFEYKAKTIIGATGTWGKPHLPKIAGIESFQGEVIHSAFYKSPKRYKDKNVLLIGAGNSAAQIYADLYEFAKIYWTVKDKPIFLPDYVDGRFLFESATKRYKEFVTKGKTSTKNDLGSIVQVEPVKKLLSENKVQYYDMVSGLTKNGAKWENGTSINIDTIIFCTGFKANLDFLEGLEVIINGRVETNACRSKISPGLWLVGYGEWTGYASATLIGVGRTAKKTVKEIKDYLILQ
ncbi:NAD(P)-binding domain-containing protein [Candidatus Kapabacteria bacterium]|nr:NAD(P)-binding domain-containing protein [Candidatus Kapabacteria bacterium]